MPHYLVSLTLLALIHVTETKSSPRIASLNPGLTDIIYSLGLTKSVVGISDYCVAPSDTDHSRIGTELTPRVEAILRLQPTHILSGQSAFRKSIPNHQSYTQVVLPLTTTEDLRSAIKQLGDLFQRREQASSILKKVDEVLSPQQQRYHRVLVAAGVSQHETPLLFMLNPFSLHGDLLNSAGFNLIEPQTRDKAWVLGPEALVRLTPDLIIVLDPSASRATTKDLYRRALSPLDKARDGSRAPPVIYLKDANLSRMGPSSLRLGDRAHEALIRSQEEQP